MLNLTYAHDSTHVEFDSIVYNLFSKFQFNLVNWVEVTRNNDMFDSRYVIQASYGKTSFAESANVLQTLNCTRILHQ